MSRVIARRADALASPIAFPRNMRRPSRAEVEAMVEGLIEYLDALDGDADLEAEELETGAREWCGSGAHRFDVGAAA